ncbi:MAG TPA: carboxypeptidase-like regulatory domain-containing protein [Candidatus Eisenbacteria bacterium]|jgi:hypothetical protein|nr:carboxypeptidase-like regulatory domain-containing protein [Candidatus Eisenbacteria bacterium]
MAGSNLRFLGNIALLFLLAAPAALAAPPTGGSGSDRDRGTGRQPNVDEMKTLGVDRNLASFAGTVLDVNNRPIGGVQVSLFMGGDVVGRAVTGSDGDYELRAPYDPSNDVTVLLWFVAPDRTLMPKELVIQESRASLENGLISKCVPRASLSPGRQFRVYLFDSDSRNKELAESGCLP